mmetsp:Transcript_30599/g.46954  ORF Transcript_30599/g.46954 Transcript_30599/m.46954 type:complete len:167 (+) Transcript_30599:108-608(+)
MAPGRYRRLDGSAHGSTQSESSEESNAAPARSLEERASDKLWALGWIVAAILVSWWSNFLQVMLTPDPHISRPYLYAFMVGLGINTIFFLYLKVYLHRVVGLPRDSSIYDVWCPRVIPTMAATGVVSIFCILRATFPVWGFMSPFVLGIEFLGSLHLLHFVPWFPQ